ncbi:MAG TPA: outer membrane beta-barrel domain-containing protein [Kofleriaceae bacterium]|jgi:outer membrane beta-barrel protein|nr:outer membrane beta-barrel domain-containing protein [Kofleriaceae bacterium]
MKNHTLWAVVSVLAVSSAAYAERRQNNLAADVAVRHRRLLVKNRFEFAPLFESTINADFRHIIGGGAKLEYHLSDKLSVGAIGVASTAINTKLVDKIRPTLEMSIDNTTREPSQDEFLDRLNTMPFHGAAYVSLTPWYGKLAAFSQAFVAFDFYFQAGLSFAQLTSNCPSSVCSDQFPGMKHPDPNGGELPADGNPNNDPPLNNGSRLGLYLGGGIHVFLNDFLALDMTVRDYAFTDNPSGADFNADLFVSNDDNRFLHHLFFGVGISVMLPTTVKRTP